MVLTPAAEQNRLGDFQIPEPTPDHLNEDALTLCRWSSVSGCPGIPGSLGP